MTRLWDKGAALDDRVLRYTAGDDHVLDNRLVRYDIAASIAHAEMLGARGLLSHDDLVLITAALNDIGAAHAAGTWVVTVEQEDCQTAIENLLTARIGAAGGRLHAGRSRNDQVLVALRLYLRDAAAELSIAALAVAEALDALGARDGEIALPGYTHMQQAMPSTVALWANGFASEIRESSDRPRRDPPAPGIFRHARAGHRRAIVARQGRGAAAVRDHAADAGSRQIGGRFVAVLHPGIQLRQPAAGDDHGFVDHAAETQSGRLRARPRT